MIHTVHIENHFYNNTCCRSFPLVLASSWRLVIVHSYTRYNVMVSYKGMYIRKLPADFSHCFSLLLEVGHSISVSQAIPACTTSMYVFRSGGAWERSYMYHHIVPSCQEIEYLTNSIMVLYCRYMYILLGS